MKVFKPDTIDDYIAAFPEETQKRLTQVRETIKKAAPAAEEVISYSMPAFRKNGILVYFAAYSKHIGFYPTSSGILAFKDEISGYKAAKGSVQFPLDKPLPLELITKIVKFRLSENMQKSIQK
ncbi:MAG: iron chaperone [Bacteroidales bacterium]